MLVRARKNVALWVIALIAAVILLPFVSFAATSPTVTVLAPLTQGLRVPAKMALDAGGNIYVADARISGIIKYNTYGILQKVISTNAVPNGLAFAPDGTLLVSQGSAVVRYNVTSGLETGRLVGGNLIAPAGIAIDNLTGYIYVVDGLANQVVVYTASGNYVKAFAQGVTSDIYGNTVNNPVGLLSRPSGITFEKISRQFAVADTNSNRVQFFDPDGNFVKSIGNIIPTNTSGSTTTVGSMQFEAPVATVFEYSSDQTTLNRIYIIDSFQSNIQVVDPATSTALIVAGTTKNYIGSSGTVNGKLMFPSDAVFDAVNKRLMVVNSGDVNITNYGIDGGTNPADTTPLTLSIDAVPATVSFPNITISGTVKAGASVSVAASSTTVAGAVIYTSSTTWKSDITGLINGSNTINVTATDAVGNTIQQSVNVTLLVSAPVITVSSSVPALTNIPGLVITGTVDVDATVTVTNNSTAVSGAATVAADGSWSYSVTLAESTNNFTITAQKPLSAVSTKTVSVTLDSIPPVLAVSALSDGSYTSNQVQNVTGTAADANAVTVLVNNTPASLINGSFSVPVSLVTGTNIITVTAGDAAGNVTVNSRTLYFDATKPQITIASPMDNSYTNNASLQINGTVDKTATITVGGVAAVIDNSNNWSTIVQLATGLNTIEVVATDSYGNVSTLKRSITLDTVKPVLAIASPAQDIATNQSSVTITGTVSDDNSITLTYLVNGKTSPVAVDAGTFTFRVDFAAEGIYPIVITATDLAGNSTTATRSVIYDITPPTVGIGPAPATVYVPAVTISGTVEAGASVIATNTATAVAGTTVYPTATTWKCDLTGLAAGDNTITVTAVDAAGNAAPSQPVQVTYLLPAPVIGVFSVPALTNAKDVVFNGTVDDGATVTVTNVSTTVGGAATVIGSTWTYKVTLAEGANNITITAQKPMSVAATVTAGLTLDSIPPVLSVSALSDGSYTSNQVQNVTGTVSDAGVVTVQVNNVPASLINGSFSVPVSLVTGANTITVVAGDAAGNVTVNSRTLNFDATKPQITVAAPMDNSYTNNAALHVYGTVDKVSTITVAGVAAIVDAGNNWSADITLVSGLNTIEVVATDLYGNSSTVKRSVTLNTVRPVLAITYPVQDIATNQSSVTITGTVSDDNAVALTYSVNGIVTPVPVVAGSFSFNVNFAVEGTYSVVVTATDLAGNITTATRNIIYDITPPALTVDPVNWQAHVLGVTITGTVEPGAVVTVKEGSTAIGTVIVSGNIWSADLSGISYDQTKLSVVATDAAGNSTSRAL